MSEYEFPSMEESWSALRHLFEKLTRQNCCGGITSLRCIYERTKWTALGPYFGPDGRIVTKLSPSLALKMRWREVVELFDDELERFTRRLVKNPRFMPRSGNLDPFFISYDLHRWLDRFLQDYEIEQIASNQSGQGPAISTLIGKMFDSFEPFKDGVRVGDMYFSTFGPEYVPLAKEIAQIAFSRVVEMVRPLATSDITLVLSINPLDLATASCFTTGWTSCADLYEGEYRSSPVAYLCDEATAIAFAFQSTESYSDLDWLEYPRKMWRQLVFFDTKRLAAVHGRHYPSPNAVLDQEARKLSARVLSAIGQVPYEWWCTKAEKSVVPTPEEKSWTLWASSLDMIHSRGFVFIDDIYYSAISLQENPETPSILVGTSQLPCVVCGDDRPDFSPGDIACPDCGGSGVTDRCCNCQQPLIEPGWHYNGQGPYCFACYFTLFIPCQHCGDIFPAKQGIQTADDKVICPRCLGTEYFECRICSQIHRRRQTFDFPGFGVVCDNCVTFCQGCRMIFPKSELRDGYCDRCCHLPFESNEVA